MKLTRRLLQLLASGKTITTNMKVNVIRTCEAHSITAAANLLKSGGVIGIPTDTIYGLACSANDCEAIKNLYDIKGRNEEKPVAICVSDFKDLKHWGEATHLDDELLKRLLPGPVTIVLHKSIHLNNPYLNPGTEKIGIRIPDFNFIREVCREFGMPMALTSANRSSEKSSLNIDEFKPLWCKLGAVFDGGSLSDAEENRKGSTVIDLSVPNEYKVIRQGIAFEATVGAVEAFGFKEVFPACR